MNKYKFLLTSLGALCWLTFLLWGLTGKDPATPLLAQSDREAGTSDDELVYLDTAGIIRVLDPDNIARAHEIRWSSPEGGWRDIVLGDFNGDNDYEIAAIGGVGQNAKLAIYDPVVADTTALDVNKTSNEIPWSQLYYTSSISSTLAVGTPLRIAAGNLDPAIPGDELIFSIVLSKPTQSAYTHNNDSRLMIWHRLTTATSQQSWQPQIPAVDFDHTWNDIVVGQIDNLDPAISAMEIVLLDEIDGAMDVYRLDSNQLTRLYTYESDARPWYAAAIGQTYTGGFNELVGVRESPKGLPNMFVLGYLETPEDGNFFKDRLTDYFDPSATEVVLANVNGSALVKDGGVDKIVNDDEIFMLRSLPTPKPPTPQAAPHLFMRNPGEDKQLVARFEVVLDADNGYKALVGLEVDGGTGQEIAIMRNNLIRIYQQPERDSATIRQYAVTNAGATLRAANLDAVGYPRLPKIVVKPNQLAQTLAAGDKAQVVITVTNEGNVENVPFNVYPQGDSSWLRASPASGQTPAQITILYDAYGLPPVKDFAAAIDIAPDHPQVPRTVVRIPVSLRTTPGLWPTPDRVAGMIDCTNRAPKTVHVRVAGLIGVPYNANLNDFGAAQSAPMEPLTITANEPYTVPLLSTVPWAKLSGVGTLLPTTLTIQFDPSPENFSGTLQQAVLDIQATNNQGVSSSIAVPVAIVCQAESYYLPWIGR